MVVILISDHPLRWVHYGVIGGTLYRLVIKSQLIFFLIPYKVHLENGRLLETLFEKDWHFFFERKGREIYGFPLRKLWLHHTVTNAERGQSMILALYLRDVNSICILGNKLHFCKVPEHLTQAEVRRKTVEEWSLRSLDPQECWGGLNVSSTSKPQPVEKGWHLHDYISPAGFLIPLPHGCEVLLPPFSREFSNLVCTPVAIKKWIAQVEGILRPAGWLKQI